MKGNHRIARPGTASSDMSVFALDYLFQNGLLRKDEVDGLIFISHLTVDRRSPPPPTTRPACRYLGSGVVRAGRRRSTVDLSGVDLSGSAGPHPLHHHPGHPQLRVEHHQIGVEPGSDRAAPVGDPQHPGRGARGRGGRGGHR